MRKISVQLLIIFLIILFSGCSTNQFIVLKESQECTTTIEGYFKAPKVYKYAALCIIFNDEFKNQRKLGKVIKQDTSGVYLIEKKEGFLHIPDTIFYDYSKIRAIVDSNYFCYYGKLKENEIKDISLKFYLNKIDDPKYTPIYLELSPDKKFGYCVKPGRYIITKIIRELSPDYYYESYPIFNFTIDALPNHINYIGDYELKTSDSIKEETITIPFFKQVNSANAGAALGLIGGIAAKLTNDSWKNKIDGYYYLNIVHSKDYISESEKLLPINQVNISPQK